jgi:hypothetical protein
MPRKPPPPFGVRKAKRDWRCRLGFHQWYQEVRKPMAFPDHTYRCARCGRRKLLLVD